MDPCGVCGKASPECQCEGAHIRGEHAIILLRAPVVAYINSLGLDDFWGKLQDVADSGKWKYHYGGERIVFKLIGRSKWTSARNGTQKLQKYQAVVCSKRGAQPILLGHRTSYVCRHTSPCVGFANNPDDANHVQVIQVNHAVDHATDKERYCSWLASVKCNVPLAYFDGRPCSPSQDRNNSQGNDGRPKNPVGMLPVVTVG